MLKRGIATLCLGGGNGVALAVEMLSRRGSGHESRGAGEHRRLSVRIRPTGGSRPLAIDAASISFRDLTRAGMRRNVARQTSAATIGARIDRLLTTAIRLCVQKFGSQ